MNTNDFVIAMRSVNGIVKNSVGVIKSVSQEGILVYFIGKNEEVRVPFGSIAVIDIDNTGKGHKHKICNICHILKRMEMFDKNQRDAQQRSTTRPSCKICRQEIDGVKLTAQERRKMETKRPLDKTIFVCPICEKRTIVGITARIVADHDHKTGKGRAWICDSCNTGLGRFKDDIVFFEKIIAYLSSFETNTGEDQNLLI